MEIVDEDEYDVVVDTLQKQRDKLWKMTESNMNTGAFNIMDTIRLAHIETLDNAIAFWKSKEKDVS